MDSKSPLVPTKVYNIMMVLQQRHLNNEEYFALFRSTLEHLT